MSMNCHDNVFIIYERASRCVGVANKRILLMNTRHHVRPRNVRVPIVRKAGKARQVKPLSLPLHTVLIFPPFPNFPHNPFWGMSYQGGRQKRSINLSVYECELKMGLEPAKKWKITKTQRRSRLCGSKCQQAEETISWCTKKNIYCIKWSI